MGVRGLSTFIAKNSEKYMENYELHSSYLIIDGNNLAAQLYRWHARCIDCFGGDYDQYAQTVKTFFEHLQKCNITPLVIFDGCYENRKLKTIYDRVRDRVSATKNLNAANEGVIKVFPLFLRELFTELVISLGYKAMRCEFEADYEMACLAKTINCPLLSYDSDFYIFDVLYIPFSALELSPKIKTGADGKPYNYIDCKLYKMENFLKSIGGMDKGVLPLLATVVGNDYIAASVFKEFYAQLKMVKRKKMDSDQQRKIESVIKWLLNETYETAAKKILGRIKREFRQKVADQIEEVAKGYHCIESSLLSYFDVDASHKLKSSINKTKRDSLIDLSNIPDDIAESTLTEEYASEDETNVEEAPGELNLEKLNAHFPEWFVHQYRSCNYPAWFMDIAVHNRYFFLPQMENFEKEHSHSICLELLAALHQILRSNIVNNDATRHMNNTQLTYISRQGQNYIQNTLLPLCKFQLPTLNEIPGMEPKELTSYLHKVLGMDDEKDLIDFLNSFDNDWKLFVLGILFWAKSFDEANKIHVYSLILCAVTLNRVYKKIGYIRTLKEANRKLKTASQLKPYLNFIKEVIPYFYMDEKLMRNPKRYYEIYTVDQFARFQSALFHIKYLNKLLLSPYEDMLISDFYNGTFIYNVFTTLKKRGDPLSYFKNICKDSMEVFNQFLQIAIEITCRLEHISEGNKKPKKRKNRQKSGDNSESENIETKRTDTSITGCTDSAGTSFDPNNPYSILNME